MRKIIILFLLVIFWVSAKTQTATIQTVAGVIPGGPVTVDITLTDFTPDSLSSFQFTVQFDSNYLKYTGITNWAPGITAVGVQIYNYGSTTAITFVWGDVPVYVNGLLCKLNFIYKSPASGCHPVTWSDTPTPRLFGDQDYNVFSVTYVDGLVCPCIPVSILIHPANQNICADYESATFSTVVTGDAPVIYQWQYYNGISWNNVVDGTPAGAIYTNDTAASMSVSGVSVPGTYEYRCYITNCAGINYDISNIARLYVKPRPAPPVLDNITQPTCTVSTGTVFLSNLPAGNWAVTRNPSGITTTGTGSTTSISGIPSATYSFTVMDLANGCTSVPLTPVVINVQPPTPLPPTVGSITQPTCTQATGSVVFSNLPSAGTWTLTRTPGGTTTTGTGTSTTVTGIPAGGTYTYVVTLGPCSSTPSAPVTINAQPVVPPAPITGVITHPTCTTATGSVALSGLPSAPWTVTATPGGITINGSSPTATFSGLAANTTYTFTVTLASSGCTSTSSTAAAVNAQPVTPSAPIVGTITQPTCATATGSVALSGLPSSSWTVTATPGGTTITGSSPTATFSGLAANTTYTFTVTLASSACTSASSTSAVINAQPVVPSAPIVGTVTQPTCATATGSVALSGLPSTAWTVTVTPGGTTITGSSPTATFSGLTANTSYTFTVTLVSSGCTSSASSTVVINAQPVIPSAPILGTITQPTCLTATGSVTLSGLPSTSWTVTANPGGATINGTSTTATFSGLSANTYTFTVTLISSGCTSTPSASATVNAQPLVPSAPVVGTIIQPTCSTATGSVMLSGLPATLWTVVATPGGATLVGSSSSAIFSGLPANATYTFTVTLASSGCTSVSSTGATIMAQPLAPSAPLIGSITQPTCSTPTGTVALSGLPTSAWTVTATPGGATMTGSSPTATFSGLAANTSYTFTVTLASTGCTSEASTTAVISSQPATPSAPVPGAITQPTCTTPTGTVILGGLPSTSWTVTATPGGATITGTAGTAAFSGLAPNTTYAFTVTLASSGCTSVPSATVTIFAPPLIPPAPLVGTVIQPTCTTATGTVLLSGLPSAPWTVTAMPGGAIMTGSSTTATFSGLAANTTYTFTVTLNSTGCTSSASSSVTINAQPVTPSAPLTGTITQPTCTTPTGSVLLSGLPVTPWIVTASPGGATITGSSSSAAFSGLAANTTYTFTVTLTSSGCSSLPSVSVTINAQPVTPSAPVIGTVTQPTCSTPTGSVILSGLPSSPWIVTAIPGGATISGSATTATFSGLNANTTYTFTVTLISSGCTSVSSTSATINVQPLVPAIPIAGTITQPTCSTATGAVELSGLPTSQWIITASPGGMTMTGTSSSATFQGLPANTTYTFTVTLASSGCTSGSSATVTINAQPETPNIQDQSTSIFSGQTFTLTPDSVPVGTTYTWTAPTYTNGVNGGSAQTNPQTNISGTLFIPSGTGTAVYTVTPTSGPCVGQTFTVTVTVTSVMHITDIVTDYDTVCQGDSVHFSLVVLGGNPPYSFTWSGTGLSDNTVQNPAALPVAGNNTYSVTVTDGTTTTDTSISVFVHSISFDTLYFNCDTYTATALPDGWVSYEFLLNNVSVQESDINTYYSSTIVNSDSITVIATDQNGCRATASVIVSCLDDIEFPSAFTPNGDKYNDEFPTDNFPVKNYELKVFDRWGLLLYSGQTGWDGTYKGKLLPPATYYYRAIIKNPNGTETEKIGSITLIKY